MEEAPTKLLAVGLDAADPRLLLEWSEDGTMPSLGALRREGAWCRLTTPPGLGDDAVWGSLSTGVSPGAHGRFFFRVIQPGSYETPYKDASWLKREPFWSALARQGRRIAVVDVPKSGLAREPGVVQVADWRCHGRSGLPAANPPELAAEIIARFGDDRTDVFDGTGRQCFKRALGPIDTEAFLAELEESVEKKREATEWLLERGGWDLFLVVFKEAHCAGHLCWDEHDPQKHLLRRIYRSLDAALGRLVARVAPTTPVVVFSSLGMDRNCSGEHLLDGVLAKLESRVVPRRVAMRRVFRRLPFVGRKLHRALRDRADAACFTVPHNEISGAVRFNVEGREPLGFVRRGDELDTICDRLTAELLALTDTRDGRPIVERVIRCDRVYAREHGDELPDLLAVWRRDAPIHGAASAAVGEMQRPLPSYRPGNHVEGGIVFARGAGVPCGVELAPADVVDLAPTLAAHVGARLEGLDGRAIEGLSPREAGVCRARL